MSSEISIALELHGISHVLSTGCTSSTDAISYAASLIRVGDAEVILSGGADACVTPGMIFGFSKMRAVSTAHNDRPAEASRPFDRARDGFVLGEGAWMVVLEREDRARARGARVYAVIEGYGSTCDAYHRVQMDPDGEQIIRAMRLAIERSGRPMYFSMWHWRPMVNGYSGFIPASYVSLLDGASTFPDASALQYLVEAGVTHIAVHCRLWEPEVCAETLHRLDSTPAVRQLARAEWYSAPSVLYELRRDPRSGIRDPEIPPATVIR